MLPLIFVLNSFIFRSSSCCSPRTLFSFPPLILLVLIALYYTKWRIDGSRFFTILVLMIDDGSRKSCSCLLFGIIVVVEICQEREFGTAIAIKRSRSLSLHASLLPSCSWYVVLTWRRVSSCCVVFDDAFLLVVSFLLDDAAQHHGKISNLSLYLCNRVVLFIT